MARDADAGGMRAWWMAFVLAGCAGQPLVSFSASEPGPGPAGPYGGDGTIDMVVAYFSFEIDREGAQGDMGGHCAFSDWSMEPTSVKLHVGTRTPPDRIVMREIHPDQSTQGVGHFGTAPTPLWRQGYDVPRSFGDGDLGTVVFSDDGAAFRGLQVPEDRWMLVTSSYTDSYRDESWQVTETLHLRYFADVPVRLDREELMCA